jgi:hypothetical protein
VIDPGALQAHLLLMRDPYARRAVTLLAGRIDRLEEGMATLDVDVQAIVDAVVASAAETATQTQAITDLGKRVADDFAKLQTQIATGTPPDPALVTSLETQITALNANTAAAHTNTLALAAIDPAAPAAPPPPQIVLATPPPATA